MGIARAHTQCPRHKGYGLFYFHGIQENSHEIEYRGSKRIDKESKFASWQLRCAALNKNYLVLLI